MNQQSPPGHPARAVFRPSPPPLPRLTEPPPAHDQQTARNAQATLPQPARNVGTPRGYKTPLQPRNPSQLPASHPATGTEIPRKQKEKAEQDTEGAKPESWTRSEQAARRRNETEPTEQITHGATTGHDTQEAEPP
jgi:hypothetical protein